MRAESEPVVGVEVVHHGRRQREAGSEAFRRGAITLADGSGEMEVGGGGGKTATGGGAGEGERSRARVGADAKRVSAANELGALARGGVGLGAAKIFAVHRAGHLVREIRNRLEAENFRARPKLSAN